MRSRRLQRLLASGCEKNIQDSEAQWAESVSTGDASVLKRILADDFVWIYPDGSQVLWAKAEAVADAQAGPGDFVSDHLDDVHVRFFGSAALAQASESWVQKHKSGKVIQGRFVWSDVWLRRHGRWQLV
jgi:ketosteroid isomerase-like protein